MRILVFLLFSLSIFLTACTRTSKQTSAAVDTVTTRRVAKEVPTPMWDPISWPHERQGALPADPAVTFGHLANGLAYAILRNDEPKDHVALRLLVRSGSFAEQGPVNPEQVDAVDAGSLDWPGDERGVLHFLEHVSFWGGEYFDWSPELFDAGQTLVQQLQRNGLNFGAHTNAHTSFDEIVYKFNAPRSDPELFTTLMKAMRDFAGGLLIKPEVVEKERGIVLSEKRMHEDARYQDSVAELNFLLEGTRVPTRLPIGSTRVIKEISPEGVKSLYKRLYRPDNLALVVVGPVDVDAVKSEIETLFGNLKNPSQPLPRVDMGKAPRSDAYRVGFHRQNEHKDVSISITQVYPESPRIDSQERLERDLSLSLASGMLSERFSQKLKEPGSPLLGFSVDAGQTYFSFVGFSSLDLRASVQNWEAALVVGEQELRRAQKYGFLESEFKRAKAALLRSAQDAVHAAPTRDSADLASSIVSSMTQNKAFKSPEQKLKLVEAFLEKIKLEDVISAFRSAWSMPESWLFMAGNPSLPENEVQSEMTQVYRRSQKVALTPWEDKPLAPWAYSEWGPPGEIVKREHIEDLNITQVQFANNVRVSLKPTDFDADQVFFSARVGSGFLTLPGADASLSYLFEGAFVVGGLEAHSFDDLQRLFHDKRVGLYTQVGEDAFEFNYLTTKKDVQTQLELFCAFTKAPGYRPESLALLRRNRELFYDNFYSQMGTVLGYRSREVLHDDDPRFSLPLRESVMSLDLNDLKNWVHDPLKTSYMEVTLIGDFQLEEAIALCAGTLGTLPKREAQPPLYEERRVVRFPQGRKPEVVPVETRVQSARIMINFPGVDSWQNKEEAALSVLMDVVEDRLFKVLRESMGAVYNVRCYTSSSCAFKGYGVLGISTETDPLNTEALTQRIQEELKTLVDDGVTQEEFERAINPIFSELKQHERNNYFWTKYVHGSILLPERLDWLRELRKNYESITVEMLNDVASRYLDWSKSVIFWAEPELNSQELLFGPQMRLLEPEQENDSEEDIEEEVSDSQEVA